MNTPRLSRKLALEAPERISDGAGGFREGWVELGTLWAEVTARTGRETAQTGAPISRMGFQVVVRGAPYGSMRRPEPEQRFREGARLFTIRAVAERDPEGRYLICFAEEEIVV